MPRPIPVAVRRQIVERHQAGESLMHIAEQFAMAYESVRNVWRLYRREGRIGPNYAACGKREVSASRRVYRAALSLKRLHPSWGAGLIRQVIVDKWPEEHLPHERSLQRWFRAAGIHTPRRKRPRAQAPVGRGKAPHNIWEMDSREQIALAHGERASWLVLSDEASGAVLQAQAFPPGARESIDRSDSAGCLAGQF
jgi:hypothetical protein